MRLLLTGHCFAIRACNEVSYLSSGVLLLEPRRRYIADKHGAFVQPALYEAFGLTVVEAMTCGLPTFATNRCCREKHESSHALPLLHCFNIPPPISASINNMHGTCSLVAGQWPHLLLCACRGGPSEIIKHGKSGFQVGQMRVSGLYCDVQVTCDVIANNGMYISRLRDRSNNGPGVRPGFRTESADGNI